MNERKLAEEWRQKERVKENREGKDEEDIKINVEYKKRWKMARK